MASIQRRMKVGPSTVYRAGVEIGLFGKRPNKLRRMEVIRRLVQTEDSYAAIGRDLGISRERVRKIAEDAAKTGIEFKPRSRE